MSLRRRMKQNWCKDSQTSQFYPGSVLIAFKCFFQFGVIASFHHSEILQKPEIFILSLTFPGHWFNLSCIVLRQVDFPSYHLPGGRSEFIKVIAYAGQNLGRGICGITGCWIRKQLCHLLPDSHLWSKPTVLDALSMPAVWTLLSCHLCLGFRDREFDKSKFFFFFFWPTLITRYKKVSNQ